ncbi:phosphotransferase family protein [Pseudofrankia sp. BMG5.37]|uniref:phosphotransferase family protein n=2 Tax=unclassified Pseudofrankia TaxID=2994372 RepID=UPI0008D8EF72|nr:MULTISPECIES: phosphotransferase family protein [unclassified Pseudofrankia]MDT3443206.1 phosphotransferase family protein [Pseudofrankia sp. BMG5.37]OHV58968.1 acyl-CoA dehydrogenase [Pseudofrankia sp. BMG5.36]
MTIEIDLSTLESRLAVIGLTGLRRLSGGASSLSYAGTATVDGISRAVVVKAAPPGLEPVRNRDVLRQASLLHRLAATAVPVPTVLWEDPGDPPEVPPVFVMSFVPGSSFEPLFDRDGGDDRDDPAVVADRMLDAARALAALHRLDPAALGLADEPRVGLTDEVRRWTRALGTVDATLVPGWEAVAKALLATEPAAARPAVVHGDFRLGNLLATGPAVTAVIDWEIWSVGDPRVDLGWFLINADPATYRRRTRYAAALPTPADLAAAYAEHLGRDVPALGWFQALACFKSAATWSLIVKHSRRRPAPDPMAEEVAGALPGLLTRAADLLG